MTSHCLRPVFHGSLLKGAFLSKHQWRSPPLYIIFHILHHVCPLEAYDTRRVLWGDRELCVSHFPFLFQFLIAQSLISLGLCWFAHWRFMCKYACGMCACLGLLITNCAFLAFKCIQSTSTCDYGLCIYLFSRIGLVFPSRNLRLIKFPTPTPSKNCRPYHRPGVSPHSSSRQLSRRGTDWSEGSYWANYINVTK